MEAMSMGEGYSLGGIEGGNGGNGNISLKGRGGLSLPLCSRHKDEGRIILPHISTQQVLNGSVDVVGINGPLAGMRGDGGDGSEEGAMGESSEYFLVIFMGRELRTKNLLNNSTDEVQALVGIGSRELGSIQGDLEGSSGGRHDG